MGMFQYGKPVAQDQFVNRTEELARLQNNIAAGVNTVMISPRRWGKSSLVQHLIAQTTLNDVVFITLDLFKVRSELEFYDKLATAVITQTNTKAEEAMGAVKRWLSSFAPSISFSNDAAGTFSLKLQRKQVEKGPEELLDLAETVAAEKGIKLVVCLDEFQNISMFDDPLDFQKKARAHWQQHKQVTYLLYGSKRHMMMELFEQKSMPFYRFGDLLYLSKIGPEYFVPYIEQGFANSGKKLKSGVAEQLVAHMQHHPYYVQQLAHILLHVSSSKKVGQKQLQEAITQLIQTNAIFYTKEFDGLPANQIHALQMILDGMEEGFTRKFNLDAYGFQSSAHLVAAMKALEKKELIERFGEKVDFVDPVFALWLKQVLR